MYSTFKRVYNSIIRRGDKLQKAQKGFGMMYTKKSACETIERYKNDTDYFTENISFSEMYDMLRYRMGFGYAESNVIIAALVLAGAKFKQE